MTSKIEAQLATIQGIVFALILLDTFPVERKLAPASHALHSVLETQISDAYNSLEELEIRLGL